MIFLWYFFVQDKRGFEQSEYILIQLTLGHAQELVARHQKRYRLRSGQSESTERQTAFALTRSACGNRAVNVGKTRHEVHGNYSGITLHHGGTPLLELKKGGQGKVALKHEPRVRLEEEMLSSLLIQLGVQ